MAHFKTGLCIEKWSSVPNVLPLLSRLTLPLYSPAVLCLLFNTASNLMVDYPPENLLYGPYAMSLDEAAIQDYAKQLLPDNLQVCGGVQSPNPLPRSAA